MGENNLKVSKPYLVALISFAIVFINLTPDFYTEAADKENCLMCHKYRFLGRIDENGKRINYNVSEHVYSKTVHHNVPCRWLVQIGVHPKAHDEGHPVIHFTSVFFTFALYGTVFGLMGLLLLETRTRKKDGIKFLLRQGTSWRGKLKRRVKK